MNKVVIFLFGLVAGVVIGLFVGRARSEAPTAIEAPASRVAASRPASHAADRAGQRETLGRAVAALEAMVSATNSGVTYQSYLDRKIDAHVAVDAYINSHGDDAPLVTTLRRRSPFTTTRATCGVPASPAGAAYLP